MTEQFNPEEIKLIVDQLRTTGVHLPQLPALPADLSECKKAITDWAQDAKGTILSFFEGVASLFSPSWSVQREAAYMRVATGREWHFYLYGGNKVSKKWQNEFERRLRRQERRNDQ